ncbi:MAG TPA: hypothetical protein ENJ09_11235 [Planctomycetes bacterium]|nr:hypothetical protein [Planctomycetota bacterium]
MNSSASNWRALSLGGRGRIPFLIPLVVLTLATLGNSRSWAQNACAIAFDPMEVPAQLRGRTLGMGGAGLRAGFQVGEPRFVVLERKVEIFWAASALENPGQPVDPRAIWNPFTNAPGSARVDTRSQLVQVSYHPTACSKLDDTTLIVAGMDVGGRTIVERWDLAWSAPLPDVSLDPDSHVSSVPVVLPSVRRTTILDRRGGPRYVTGICGVRRPVGAAVQAVVQYAKPNDIYLLDVADGSEVLLASSSGAPGILTGIRALTGPANRNHNQIEVLEHSTRGYLYRFWRTRLEPGQKILVLVDANKDGSIDDFLELTPGQYTSQGLDNLRNYDEFWLE